MPQNPLFIILGPTAAGKTKLAVSIADEFSGEVLSADSRQIFRDMDIGTGKDLKEYQIGNRQIPYHLINIKQAGEKYNVNLFKEDFYQAFEDVTKRNKLPILCGGTGMYIHSILQNYELTAIPKNEELRFKYQDYDRNELQEVLNSYPVELRNQADTSSSKRLVRAIEIAEYLKFNNVVKVERPNVNPLVIGLQSDITTRRNKILDRLDFRLKNGLIEEVENLKLSGVSDEILTFYGLEYKFVVSYLAGEINFEALKERLGIAICQFAKRQMTFFRKMEKDGVQIHWLDTHQGFENIKLSSIDLINSKFQLK